VLNGLIVIFSGETKKLKVFEILDSTSAIKAVLFSRTISFVQNLPSSELKVDNF